MADWRDIASARREGQAAAADVATASPAAQGGEGPPTSEDGEGTPLVNRWGRSLNTKNVGGVARAVVAGAVAGAVIGGPAGAVVGGTVASACAAATEETDSAGDGGKSGSGGDKYQFGDFSRGVVRAITSVPGKTTPCIICTVYQPKVVLTLLAQTKP